MTNRSQYLSDDSAKSRRSANRRLTLLGALVLLASAGTASAFDTKEPTPLKPAPTETSRIPVVLLVNPAEVGYWFWDAVTQLTQDAATDLGFAFEVIYGRWDPIFTNERISQHLATQPTVDYLLFSNEKRAAESILTLVEKTPRTQAVSIVNGFSSEEQKTLGLPGGRFTHWIGTIAPDNRQAGKEVAQALLDALPDKGCRQDGRAMVLALGGDRLTPASVERLEGLDAALQTRPDAKLQQTVYVGWENAEIKAKEVVVDALKRYPDLCIVWAANDTMALGALQAAKDQGRVPGKNFFSGGVNSSPAAISSVLNKTMTISIGGHFTDGAVALLWLKERTSNRGNYKPFVLSSLIGPAENFCLKAIPLCNPAKAGTNIDFAQLVSKRESLTLPMLLSGQ